MGIKDLFSSWSRRPNPEPVAPAPDAVADVAAGSDILGLLTERVVVLSGGRLRAAELDPRARLLDRGWLDSITLVQLLVFVEERWAVRVPEARVAGRLGTLAALAEHIASNRPLERPNG